MMAGGTVTIETMTVTIIFSSFGRSVSNKKIDSIKAAKPIDMQIPMISA